MFKIHYLLLFVMYPLISMGQNGLSGNFPNYSNPRNLRISRINIKGISHLDPLTILSLSGLHKGDVVTIPGPDLTQAIQKIWDQGIVEDVNILCDSIKGNEAYLTLNITEKERLSRLPIKGVKKKERAEIGELTSKMKGHLLTQAILRNTQNIIRDYFHQKGYFDVSIQYQIIEDPQVSNYRKVLFKVSKGKRVRIRRIEFIGNESISGPRLKKLLKNTKVRSVFRKSRFEAGKWDEDKLLILDHYRSRGFQDVKILNDSLTRDSKRNFLLQVELSEGNPYFIREIKWKGNHLYPDSVLTRLLGLDKGDVYNPEAIQVNLTQHPGGKDIITLYMDQGYIQFGVQPVVIGVDDDSITLEMRLLEGKQYIVNKILIEGNDLTNDRVLMREIRNIPGQIFRRSDVTRTIRELGQLGFIDPYKVDIKTKLNKDQTVDIIYQVTEKSDSNWELSGGWGGTTGFVGTAGIRFNNFSARNLFEGTNWKPLPTGDGQELNLRVQSNGGSYKNYGFSFKEPWLGGKKPNAFSVSLNHAIQKETVESDEGESVIKLTRVGLGLGKKLKWPNDHFSLHHNISLAKYDLQNYGNALGVETGDVYDLSLSTTLAHNNLDNFQFPRSGTSMTLKLALTPPYSLWGSAGVNRNLAEYNRWEFDGSFFLPVTDKLVIKAGAHLGFIGGFGSHENLTPFNRYSLGGSGMVSGSDFLLGVQPIGLRGYQDNSILPLESETGLEGGVVYNKVNLELRYLISQSPLIYALGFVEGANTWNNYQEYNPFNMFSSAGVGIRVNLPMIGWVGLDYGIPINDTINGISPVKQKFTLILGNPFR